MKILFLSNIPTPNQLDFVEEVNKYIELKYVTLYSTEKGRDWNLSLNKHTTILNYKHKLSEYVQFFKLLKEYNPDIVLVGGYSIYLSNFSYIYSLLYKKKFVYWLEKPNKSLGLKEKIKYIYFKTKFTFFKPNLVLAIGRETVKYYLNFFKNVKNLPYSMNLEKYYNSSTEKNDIINFLFCGRLVELKNIVNIIAAFKTVRSKNISLNILGSGELEDQLKKISKNDNRINFLGFVEPFEIYTIYAQNDVFILPSIYDGWALVINEAMASSMPIIGTKEVGAIEEYIIHKQNGFICEIDENSIKEGLEFYINNKELIKEHGIKNKEIISKSLADTKNSALKFKELMETLI